MGADEQEPEVPELAAKPKIGRPKGSTRGITARVMISFPVTLEEAEQIDLAASARGVSRAEMVREAVKRDIAGASK